MSRPYAPPSGSQAIRPTISDVQTGPEGRWFTVTFLPEQALPSHRNAHPIVIEAQEGAGVLTAASCGSRQLVAGDAVQLEPQEVHDVVAGAEGLVLRVRLIAACCDSC